jgi:hypothetical protein
MDGRLENVSSACFVCWLPYSLHHSYADDQFGGSLSLDYSTFGITCGRKGRAIRFRTKEASELCFT